MSGMYWGLTGLSLLGKLHMVDAEKVLSWVMTCQHSNGGFGGSGRNDPHLLYTLSAVQVLALYNKLELVDKDKVAACKSHPAAPLPGTSRPKP